jgi:hypothetical protein
MRIIITLLFALFFISGCSQSSPYLKIAGSWKSLKVSAIDKKPYTVIFFEHAVSLHGKTMTGFEYIEKDGVILVNRAGYGTIFTITPANTPGEIDIENHGWGAENIRFIKTTSRDVEAIEKTPPPPDRRNEAL